MELPVVDLSRYSLDVKEESVSDEDLTRLAQELCEALSTIGFVYIKGHGIPESQVVGLSNVYRKFFAQSTEYKAQFQRGFVSSGNFGWVQAEQEALNPERPKDLKEAFNFSYEPIQKWPDQQMNDASIEFFQICTRLSMRILDLMAIGLDLKDRKFFTRCHQKINSNENFSTVRCLHYPPVPPNIKPGQIRCGEHSDYGSITLLFQDDVGGLELLCPKAGRYLAATPKPGCILVNIGDIMQMWTAGKLRATKHKVVIPEDDIGRQRERQSIAFFVHPDDDVMVKSIDSDDDTEAVNAKEWSLRMFKSTYK